MNRVLEEDFEYIANSEIDYSSFKGKNFLITGATGLIGSLYIKSLLYCDKKFNLGITVYALVRDVEKASTIFSDFSESQNLKFVVADLLRDEICLNDDIDYIVHAAAITNSKMMVTYPVDTIIGSIIGTQKILELARLKNSDKVVYISSMEIYGSINHSGKVKEDELGTIDLNNVRSCYPEGKRMCECLCTAYVKQYNVNVCYARLAQTFGAGVLPNENRVFAQFAKSVINGENIVLHTMGKSEGNYVYTADAMKAISLLLLFGQCGYAYNVSNENSHTTIADMAQLVASEFGCEKSKVVFDIPSDFSQLGYAPDVKLFLDSTRLKCLGWKPRFNLIESYERMIRFMKNY